MNVKVKTVEDSYKKAKVPQVMPGDTVRVHQRIKEGDKERTQIFEGVVLQTRNQNSLNYMIRVRKISSGVGVERTFPMHSPTVEKVTVVKRTGRTRANLSYLRGLTGKKAKLVAREFEVLSLGADTEPEIDEAGGAVTGALAAKGEDELDREVTEINPVESNDALNDSVGLDAVSKSEEKLAAREGEEGILEQFDADDEADDAAEETQIGLDRVAEENTRRQDGQSST